VAAANARLPASRPARLPAQLQTRSARTKTDKAAFLPADHKGQVSVPSILFTDEIWGIEDR
jgi:hypothetical protein